MRIGVLAINFGEPEDPTLTGVEAFLERIFLQNAPLESHEGDGVRKRAAELARRRAPGLLEEYREIGGSPLNRQADARVRQLHELLEQRDWDVRTWSAFQYTPPLVADAVARARDERVDLLVGLPMYPLCGHSTTVAALDDVQRALTDLDWDVDFVSLSGWHRHPAYLGMRADHIRTFVDDRGLDLEAPDTLLYFSAHGTPLRYLEMGNRYDRYVAEHCRDLARSLRGVRYAVGFQNHSNRGIPWTQPDNEDRIAELEEHHLVVDPVSFLHEQSETLAELDHELNEYVESLGKVMHRVPVPHDDPKVALLLADLVGRLVARHRGEDTALAPCRCRPGAGSWCTNGDRELPPSPFVPPAGARVRP